MDGYQVTIKRLIDNPDAKDNYSRERAEEIYDQRVVTLDVQAVIAVVNGLTKSA